MYLFLLVIFLLFICSYFYKIHLFIDIPSFFKRGFIKKDNAHGLYCYCGKQGSGKTYSAIKFVTDMKLKFGYRIITNIHSFKTFPDTIYLDNILDIIDFILSLPSNEQTNYIILFDEIFTILEKSLKNTSTSSRIKNNTTEWQCNGQTGKVVGSPRQSRSTTKEILAFISQLRKRNIIFVTTAQEWLEINITFRRYVRYQVDCKMISLPILKKALVINDVNNGYELKWDNNANEYVAPRLKTIVRKGNKSIIDSYDTFETINTF